MQIWQNDGFLAAALFFVTLAMVAYFICARPVRLSRRPIARTN